MTKIITLDNGLKVVYERMPNVKSVALGVFVMAGSRFENKENNGISHLIEHMLFKGTEKRTAKEIATEMDYVGGQLNAFTSAECTCFYAKALSHNLSYIMDIVSDMYINPVFNQVDFDTEVRVIQEEIRMYEDSHEELVHDMLQRILWKDHSLGFNVSGSLNSVACITRDQVIEYKKSFYTPQNTVISLCGGFKEAEIFPLLNKYFNFKSDYKTPELLFTTPQFFDAKMYTKKEAEQAHLAIAFEGVHGESEQMYAVAVLNNILGYGMSSRLFQKLREEEGLAYSVYSGAEAYKNAGLFTIYAAANSENLQLAEELIFSEIEKIRNEGVSQQELNKGKEQLKCSFLMGAENASTRMMSIGKAQIVYNRIRSRNSILRLIDKVTVEDINTLANTILTPNNFARAKIIN